MNTIKCPLSSEEQEILVETLDDNLKRNFPKHTRRNLRLWRIKLWNINKPIMEKEADMDLKKVELEELLEEVSNRGFMSSKRKLLVDRSYRFPKTLKPFKIGIVSDTHLGSTCQQITLLHEAYKDFQKKEVKMVLNTGDVVEGNGKLFKGQSYEMFIHGADAMADYTIKNYPKLKNIPTYMIGGSHDYSFFKEDGTDVLKRIGEERKDLKYLGMFGASLKIGGISIYLMHGSGGVPYARSYRMQKIIEQFPPERKPNMLFLGHYHTQAHLPNYRNVAGFQMPCFQTQTTYLRGKGLAPELGYVIVEITPDTKGIASYKTEWHGYYVPIEGDY